MKNFCLAALLLVFAAALASPSHAQMRAGATAKVARIFGSGKPVSVALQIQVGSHEVFLPFGFTVLPEAGQITTASGASVKCQPGSIKGRSV